MPRYACQACGTTSDKPRCPAHQRQAPRIRGRRLQRIRAQIIQRDHGLCQHCGQPVTPGTARVDHVIAHANGGPDTMTNRQLLCESCNALKGAL